MLEFRSIGLDWFRIVLRIVAFWVFLQSGIWDVQVSSECGTVVVSGVLI